MQNTDEPATAIALRVIALLAIVALLPATRLLAQPAAPPPDDAPNAAFPQLVPVPAGSSTKWSVPPGLTLDARQRVQTFITLQGEIDKTPPEDVNWLQMLPELQAILAADSDSLVSPNAMSRPGAPLFDQPRISLKRAVTEFIAGLPAAGRKAWQQLYSDTAVAQLRAATQSGESRAIATVASRFVETPAGWQATEQLGVRSLDTGLPVLAIHYLERLRRSPEARRDREPRLTLTIAAAWLLLEREDQAGLAVAELQNWLNETFPDDASGAGSSSQAAAIKQVRSTGTRELLASLRTSLPGQLAVSDDASDWRQPAGSVTNSHSVAPVAATGRVQWQSITDGFSQRPTAADRLPFATPWADYDDEPYPQTPAQMAGMVELAIEYLDRIDIEEAQVGLPVGQPLIVGGKAIMRTFDRVRAVDVATGSLLWESFQQDSAFTEQFNLAGAKSALNFPRSDIRCPVNQAQEALLLARTRLDRTTGTISSDGQQVYFVNGGGIASRATRHGMARLAEIIPKSSNTLRAVDVTTGSLVWEVGGASDTPRLPGAGRFFLGPPTCLDDGLFVTAEDDGQAILLKLDPSTGTTNWQQELGETIAPAINEALRRITGEAPVVAGGLLVCTASSGQVFAVEPDEQRIVWMSSYPSEIQPVPAFPATIRSQSQRMNTDLQDNPNRWRETLVVASDGRLILAAVDSPVLTCLDVVTGEVLWKQPRRDSLFVAVVHDGRVVVVGEYGVRSLDLHSGETQWVVAFENRVPAGRGVRSGETYHLPVSVIVPPVKEVATENNKDDADAASLLSPVASLQGAVLSLDLKTGRVLAESAMPDGQRVGNLSAADGRLVSQSFNSVVGLESISDLQTRLAQQIEQQPEAPATLLARARLRLHNGDRSGMDDLLETLSALARQKPPGASASTEAVRLQRDAEALLIGQILEMQKQGDVLDQKLFDLLDQIDLDAGTQLTMQRVKTDSLLRQGQFAAAFDQLLALASAVDKSPEQGGAQPTIVDDGVTRPVSGWMTSRLAEVYRSATLADDSASQVVQIEESIANRLNDARQTQAAERDAALRNWLSLLAWHASANDVRLELAASQPPEKLQVVEQLLAPLVASESPASVAQGQAALIDAYAKAGRVSALYSAQRRLQAIIRQHTIATDTPLLNGQSLADLQKQWLDIDAFKDAQAAIKWPETAPKETLTEVEPPAAPLPARILVERLGNASEVFDGWIMEMSVEGLTAIDADGRHQWTVPASDVPGFPSLGNQRFRAVWMTGGSLFATVINSDMAVFDASLSPPKRLWTKSLIANDPALLPFGQKSYEFGMLVSTYRLKSGSRALGAVDLLTPTTLVWRSNNRLRVVDARSGEPLWERPAQSGEGFVFGDDRLLVLLETAPSSSRVFETATGRLLATFDLPERTYLVSVNGSSPVFITPQDMQLEFFGLDVMTGQRRWEYSCERSSSVTSLPFESWLVTLKREGQLEVRDLANGVLLADLKTQPLQQPPGELHFHATADGFAVFTRQVASPFRLGVNRLSTAAREYSPINGFACGVDLTESKLAWESQVSPNFLLKPQPRNVPVVLLAGSHTVSEEGGRLTKPRYELTAIDTRTGKPATQFSTDEAFLNVDARLVAKDDKSARQVEVRVTDSTRPVTITLDYNRD